ncbi:MAG: COX15/CtaA family protein [Bacteroidota bacterium]|nr:COX15/CtaA family protein [Bacteroidota bacterium]
MEQSAIRRFIILAQVTLVFVYLVIIAGSVVRATGSGMGCPDWPKCFGNWIPPTDISQLPENYKELYAGDHNAVGEFNALRTWTEYGNRLVGAILGLLIFAQFLFSFKFRRRDKKLFLLSFIEFILIGFQGWLGSKVVSSNLSPVKITVHMVVALVILSIAILIIHRAKKLMDDHSAIVRDPAIKRFAILVLILTIIQIMLGTQIREEVDVLVKNFDAEFRSHIISYLGPVFKIHRSFSWLLLVINLWLIYKILKGSMSDELKSSAKLLGIFLMLEMLAGIILNQLSIPAVVQPVHLFLACVIYGLQSKMILKA